MSYLLGAKAIKRLAQEQNGLGFFHAKLDLPLFIGDEESNIFAFVKDHFTSFHALPAIETLESKFPNLKGVDVPEPSAYYLKQLENRFAYNLIKRSTADAVDVLKNNPQAVDESFGRLSAAWGAWLTQKHRARI